MGKLVDVLEIDSNVIKVQVNELEIIFCKEMFYLKDFCFLEIDLDIGKLVGIIGELFWSYFLVLI